MARGLSLYGNTVFAIGWDRASVILKLFAKGEWKIYRLPIGSHSFDHAWNTEWFRIREAQTERFLMDAHGIFYELPVLAYEGKTWGIKRTKRSNSRLKSIFWAMEHGNLTKKFP